jgi:hypothetical protein
MPITKVTHNGVPPNENLNLNKVQEICDEAIKAIHGFEMALAKSEPNDAISGIIEKYFFYSNGTSEWGTAKEAIQKVTVVTRTALEQNNITVKVGYFNYASSNVQNEINMALAQTKDKYQFVRYLIHEATHLYPKTVDHADRGYVNNNGEYREPGLTREEALKNADSYGAAITMHYYSRLI